MDHPSNPAHPNRWLAMSEPYGLLAISIAAGREQIIKVTQPLTLRFSVLVHSARPDKNLIEREYEHFAKSGASQEQISIVALRP